MPRQRRVKAPGLVFHVLNRAAKRARLFANSRDYAAFEQLLAEGVASYHVALFAYCIMPNHWHLLLAPNADGALSRFMHWLTTTHSRRWQLVHDVEGTGAVYQGRFRSIPVSNDEHFLWVRRYIERNALRAHLVERAEAWRWSSLWHECRHPDAQWLASSPVTIPVNWTEHVNVPQTDAELNAFRRAVQNGEPFGPTEWGQRLAREFKLHTGRPRGRPRRPGIASVLEK